MKGDKQKNGQENDGRLYKSEKINPCLQGVFPILVQISCLLFLVYWVLIENG